MDFKKRLIEELNIIGGNDYKDLYREYVNACEKVAKEYHEEQKKHSIPDINKGLLTDVKRLTRCLELCQGGLEMSDNRLVESVPLVNEVRDRYKF